MAMLFPVEYRGLKELRAAARTLGAGKISRLQRKALTDTARLYRDYKQMLIASDIDRPAPFTRRAYDFDGAKAGGPLRSRTYVRPKQARYLGLVETGGDRSKGTTGDRPIWIKKAVQDRYGGLGGRKAIERRFTSRSAMPNSYTIVGRRARYAVGAKRYAVMTLQGGELGRKVYGLFEKRKMGSRATSKRLGKGKPTWRTRLLVEFEDRATYKPQLHFVRDAQRHMPKVLRTQTKRAFDLAIAEAFARRSGTP